MAKRFTDSDKWKNPSFRDMANEYRWLWLYILDNCDAAGIWRLDFALASYCIGYQISPRQAQEHFEDKIIICDHDKWFIPSFVTFQYGELNDSSRPHQSVMKTLLKNGVDPKTLTLQEGYPKGIHTLKEKDKDKEQDKDSYEGGVGETKFKPDLEALYRRYPRKQGKTAGMRKLRAMIKGHADYLECSTALDNYLAYLRREKTEPQFIMHFSTWVNQCLEWLDPNHGQSESFASSGAGLNWDAITKKAGA